MLARLASLRLRTKAAAVVGLILVAVLGVNGFLSARLLVRELRAGHQVKAAVLGGLFVKDVRKVLDFGLGLKDLEDASERCRALVSEHPDLAQAMIVDATGTVLFHSDPARAGQR
jgi:hypothetical protein